MTEENKEVVKTQSTAPALTGGAGMLGEIDPKDLILPRAELAQALSPSVQEGRAKPGEIINNLTGDKYELPLDIIPVKNEKNFIKWLPRDQGGGMVYRTDDPADLRVIEDTKWINNQKPACTSYLNFLCLIAGEEIPLVISFHDTGYQTGRQLLSMLAMSGGAIKIYKLGAKQRTNNLGTFWVYTVSAGGDCTPEDLIRAQKFHDMFAKTKMKFSDEREAEPTAVNPEDEDF